MARVTIISDASFCPDTHAGGYGCYVASVVGKKYFSGAFKAPPATSEHAEMMGIVNGLCHAIKLGAVRSKDMVLLQCDCIGALNRLQNMKAKGTDADYHIVYHLWATLNRYELSVSFRHVKGHTSAKTDKGGRYHVNRKCDALAKRHMQKQRRKFNAASKR